MKQITGILVVNRFELMRQASRAGVLAKRTPSLPMTPEKIFDLYRGFDGQSWPDVNYSLVSIEDGLADINQFDIINDYKNSSHQSNELDLVILSRDVSRFDDLRARGWCFVGFDVGYFESEWSHFSCVLSEIVFGVHHELRAFSTYLNQNLLFSSLEESMSFLAERSQIASMGKDVEEASLIESLAIFARDIAHALHVESQSWL